MRTAKTDQTEHDNESPRKFFNIALYHLTGM